MLLSQLRVLEVSAFFMKEISGIKPRAKAVSRITFELTFSYIKGKA